MHNLFELFATIAWILCGFSGMILAQSNGMEEVVRPVFRIVAPQVICKRNRNATDVELPKQITISMQTQGGQTLNYRVRMYFEVLGGFRGQQHSIILWNNVRRLEHKINTSNRKIISEKNQINVNNTELTSGVYYIFKIVGIDELGVESDPQNFTVTFSDGIIKRTNADGSIIPDDISFLLLGAEATYADVDYTVEADVFFCEPRNDYFIRWNITHMPPPDDVEFLRNRGSLLRIPAGTFRGGINHTIQASLMRANDSVTLLSQSLKVSVLGRGYSVVLAPELVTTGIGQAVQISVQFRDPDNHGLSPQVSWSCSINEAISSNSSTNECDGFESSLGLVQSAEFYVQGKFTIAAEVKIGQNESTLEAQVQVHKDIIARPILFHVPVHAIPAGKRFELEAIVDDMVPNCYCYWEVLNETNFAFFDQSVIPDSLGNTTVYDLDGNFLSELVDYGNATLSKDIQLTIPAKDEIPNYEGLLGNSQYKFRLNAICPAPITDLDDVDAERPNVTSFVDLILATNAPPIGRELEVTPNKGNALKTVFKFSTGVASDEYLDYPLKYNFMIHIDRFAISVGEYYENMVTTTVLPYSVDPIPTIYEVCDSRSACSTINGPNVTVKKWPMTDREFSIIADRFSASMERLEYDKAFRLALITGISLKNTKDQIHLTPLRLLAEKLIAEQATRLQTYFSKSSTPKSIFVTTHDIINFVSHARQTLSVFGQNNDALIRQLLKLLDTLYAADEDAGTRRKRRSVITTTSDSTHPLDNASQKSDEILAKLELSETLMQSSDVEVVRHAKTDVIQTVHGGMMRICRKESFSPKSYRKTFVKMETREITAKQLQRVNHSIPLKNDRMPAIVSFNGLLLFFGNRPTTKCCIGKAMYMSDFVAFDDETPEREIFEVVVITLGDGVAAKNKSFLPLHDVSGQRGFDVLVPFYKPEEAKQLKCQVWDESEHRWSDSICETIGAKGNYVKCKCNQLGFFRLTLTNTTENSPGSAGSFSTVPSDITTINGITDELDGPITISTPEITWTSAQTVMEENETSTNEPTPTDSMDVNVYQNETNPNTGADVTDPILEVVTLPPKKSDSEPKTVKQVIEEVATLPQSTATTTLTTESTLTTSATTQTDPPTTKHPTPPFEQSAEVPTVKIMVTSKDDQPSSTADTDKLTTNPSSSSSTGYAVAGALVALGSLVVGALYVYHRRKGPNAINLTHDEINTELREPVAGIKYARFHDEHTMHSNNSIETLFNGHG